MKRFRNGKVVYDAADLAEAFGYPNPSAKCDSCGHARYEHRRVIITPGGGPDHKEEHYECERWDRRRKTGVCSCSQFEEADHA